MEKKEIADAPKVVIDLEGAEKRQDVREKERERETKVEEIREKLQTPAAEKLARRSLNERSLADDIIEEMRVHLHKGDATESSMRHYHDELVELRNRIEGLQADAHSLDAVSFDITNKQQVSEIFRQNYETLKHIETALHASTMESDEARQTLGAPQKKIIVPEGVKSSSRIEDEIEAKYGADPESLRIGGGPFWKRTAFNFRHWLAEKTNQKSEYDLFREAQERERRAQPEPTLTIPESEKEYEGLPAPPEEILRAARKERLMTIDRARVIIPHAEELFVTVKTAFGNNPSAVAEIHPVAQRENILSGQGPDTDFVLLIGKYLDMRDDILDKERAEALYEDIVRIARKLKIKTNPLLQQALSLGKLRVKDVTSGVKRRTAIARSQGARWRF